MSVRLLLIEDLFNLEQIGRYYGGAYSFSPDGKTLAYVVQRAKATTKNHKQDFLHDNDRADIWLADLATSKSFNLTKGIEEDVGYWSPAWSPDGKHLAMLSTKGGNVTLWAWSQATESFQQLTSRGVNSEDATYCPYVWISNKEIICTVLAEGEKPWGMIVETDSPQKAWQGSQTANRGKEVTVSVLKSGVAVDLSKRDPKTSIVVNIGDPLGYAQRSCTTKTLFTANTQEYTLSGDKNWLACLETVDIRQPQADLSLNLEFAERYALRLISLQDREPKRLEVSNDVLADSLCWSPDSQQLAFIGYEDKRDRPPQIYIYDCQNNTVQTWGSKINAAPLIRNKPRLLWAVDNTLLVYAAQKEAQPTPQNSYDWWLVRFNSEPICLTADLETPPVELLAEVGSKSFVGLVEGNLWRIRLKNNPLENITTELEAKLTAIVYPGDTSRGDTQVVSTKQEFTKIIVSTEVEEQTEFYQIDLVEDTWKLLEKPQPKAQVAAYESQTDTVIFTASDNTGTYLWSSHNSKINCFLETNTFLRDIKLGQLRQIEYTSLDGEKLRAQLILPPDYDSECTYPVITEVYPGWVISPTPHPSCELNFVSPLNFQLAAAQGYVFLQPSIPLKPEGEADDPMLKLLQVVLPAVEKAIALNIADPERLYLMGHSFGGYAVYGLITQTHRFKAAVSLAGLANLVSLYGAFDPRFRYRENAHEDFFQGILLESGQTAMGNPPWKNLGRYLRNSPIFAVDRVQTPLMIIQGDMDYVPIQQGEEFFASLYRQGKRAEFVRYWGEGHVLSSPANIKDMWERIFAWFGDF
ncbi:S9 family peptidase [Pleurocapsa sp. FMAR1]|uniref:S9 family peptidase n=1 Tax=Pleurocapsa sp. FMAR1 TaxID=3040204 RepID=UPI0029C6BFF5|nr:prolyl oligopeptidase family serine peptidase [Pleurocapsa sp. FMAR1]